MIFLLQESGAKLINRTIRRIRISFHVLPGFPRSSALLASLFLCLALAPALSIGQDAPQQTLERIRQLVNELGADRFAIRQNAMRELGGFGAEALEPLLDAVQTGQPETQMRAVLVIGRLAVGGERDCQRQAQDALGQLAKSEDRDISRLAQQTIATLGRAMEERAVSDLRALGAIVDITEFHDGLEIIRRFSVTITPEFRGSSDDYSVLTWLTGQTQLILIGEQIDDRVVRLVSKMPSLYFLTIKRGTITNQAVEFISGVPTLRILHLYYVDIDDRAISSLASLNRLTQLRLFGTGISREASKRIEESLTTTEVDWRNGAFLGIYFDNTNGPCIVNNVVRNSAADVSGFQPGDRVLRFADTDIKTGQQFLRVVAEYSPGDEVEVLVQRNGEELPLHLELGRFPDIEEFKED